MLSQSILLLAWTAALSGTAQAQDISTDDAACGQFCINNVATDNPAVVSKCNPVTQSDFKKCVCENKTLLASLESCAKLSCPNFQAELKAECDEEHDALSGGAGAKIHSGTSVVIGASALIAGALLV